MNVSADGRFQQSPVLSAGSELVRPNYHEVPVSSLNALPLGEPHLTTIFVPPNASKHRVQVSHECSICSQDVQQPTKHTKGPINGSQIADAQQRCLNVTTSTKSDIYHQRQVVEQVPLKTRKTKCLTSQLCCFNLSTLLMRSPRYATNSGVHCDKKPLHITMAE